MRVCHQKICLSLCAALAMITVAGCEWIDNLTGKAKKQGASPSTSVTATAVNTNKKPAPAGNVLARVGDWTLTEDQFKDRLKLLKDGLPNFDEKKPGNKEAVLNELVRQQLLVQDAETSGVGQQKEIVDAVEDFRRTLLVQELANKLTKDIVATDKEAQEYYNKNKALFVTPVEWRVREIVAADEATAKGLLVQVLQGGDFAAIAKASSKGKTASDGGALTTFTKAPFEAMQTALATLDAGGVSGVFKGPEGYYIVKVESKKGGDAKVFFAVKADLISGLTLRKQQEAILKRIDELAAKTKVEINKELLGTAESPTSK